MLWLIVPAVLVAAFAFVGLFAQLVAQARTLASMADQDRRGKAERDVLRAEVSRLRQDLEDMRLQADLRLSASSEERSRLRTRRARAIALARKNRRASATYRELFWHQQAMTGKSRELVLKLHDVLMPDSRKWPVNVLVGLFNEHTTRTLAEARKKIEDAAEPNGIIDVEKFLRPERGTTPRPEQIDTYVDLNHEPQETA